jgi:hypothetical protein
MSFLQRFFAGTRRSDPTADWPEVGAAPPEVALDQPAIGRLKFGSPLEEARYLGKPDSCRSLAPTYLELVYAKAGFQLDYENNGLAYAAFFVGPDPCQPRVGELGYCAPQLRGGRRFSSATTRKDLIGVFGQPRSVDDLDDDETILYFGAKGLVLEFELNATGCLKRWNLYPEERAAR